MRQIPEVPKIYWAGSKLPKSKHRHRKSLNSLKTRPVIQWNDLAICEFLTDMGFSHMELRMEVYNAARDGKLNRLRIFLDPRPKDEVSKLVHSKINGATPLIMAARNGHTDVVDFLVDKCSADVELVGSVTFDGENIEGAPPLWCAAAAGHLDIVKYLLASGASVNNTTYTNSTPLRAACFDGHYDIVKYLIDNGADIEIANRHGHTCLMISCYKGHHRIVKYLLERGADVNRKSLKGNTALHDCAESGSLEIMKLLLEHNAQMEKDSYEMTPLLAASVTGHTKIVDFLIQRQTCTRTEKIDALELLGATYVDKKRDMLGALKYWKSALQERYRDTNNIIEKPRQQSPIAAYENATEVKTFRELEELITDPDGMRMQALLLRERILGPAHPDTSYYIRYRGAVYADMGNFERCITLWMYALEMQQKILDSLSPMTQSSFLSFAELFSFMMSESQTKKPQNVSFEDTIKIFQKSLLELESGQKFLEKSTNKEKDLASFNRLLVIILHLISLMCKTESTLEKDQVHSFKKLVYKLVHLDPRGSHEYSLLHLCCSRSTTTVGRYPVCSFPSADVVRLLLDVGASTDVTDQESNTPLHVAASNRPIQPEIVHILLNREAHFDAHNQDRKSAYQLLSGTALRETICPARYMTLQCLAARIIVENGIRYEQYVSRKLAAFIKMH